MIRRGFCAPPNWFMSLLDARQASVFLAAGGLVVIQVVIGVVMKASQTDGKYSFSPSSSLTISEFLKFLLSSILFYRETRIRFYSAIGPSTKGILPEDHHHQINGTSINSEPKLLQSGAISDDIEASNLEDELHYMEEPRGMAMNEKFTMRTFWRYVKGEVHPDIRFGFCNLALLYLLINNTIFISYAIADPGTIQLTKSGVTFITALVMIATLDATITKTQWIAITIQICGLVITQYQPGTGATYPWFTYLVLLCQVFISASAGVYNQALLKGDDSSLHADNMILYACGAVYNLLCHIVIKIVKSDEPNFFQGYDHAGAIMVIVNNVFIGLAITAVYKYADAVVKCFATAFATGILLYISPLLFGTHLSFLVIPGTIIVFIASWLYMEHPYRNPAQPATNTSKPISTILSRLARRFHINSKPFVVISASITITIIGILAVGPEELHHQSALADNPGSVPLVSPFAKSMAVVRYNSPRWDRTEIIKKYEPFFGILHFSMPDYFKSEPGTSMTLGADQETDSHKIYKQSAALMQLILDTAPEIDGMLYFHFDAWIDPLGWAGMDKEKIHFPTTNNLDNSLGPRYTCMYNTTGYPGWWGWGGGGMQTPSKRATRDLYDSDLGFILDPEEFCVGWSDIWFIPRKYFKEFITLSAYFEKHEVFHEVAIPTMLRIIDRTHRSSPYEPVLNLFGDCWGHCCRDNPDEHDVTFYKCGHRLNYLNTKVIDTFYDKLDRQAKALGQAKGSVRWDDAGFVEF